MKNTELKVGMNCEVITVTSKEPTLTGLMKIGDTGIVAIQYSDGDVSDCIGNTIDGEGIWFLFKEEFKKVGRLTITKLK